MNKQQSLIVLLRYIVLLLVAFPRLDLFYLVFTPLTVYPVFFILDLVKGADLVTSSLIMLEGQGIELIPACIAGSAYYLLLILNLTTPMNSIKRIKSIFFLFASFLILNIARIILFSFLLLEGYEYFDLAHNLTWYAGSTVLVILLWFANVYIFKIREIPIYTDFKAITKNTFKHKKRKK